MIREQLGGCDALGAEKSDFNQLGANVSRQPGEPAGERWIHLSAGGLVVLDQFNSYAQEVDRSGQLASDLSLKHGMTVSKVFIREAEWRHGDTAFLFNVR